MSESDQLPPAVPTYKADLEFLHAQLGQAHAYVGQLGMEMRRRAVEANTLHDSNIRLTEELTQLRGRVQDLEQEVKKLRGEQE